MFYKYIQEKGLKEKNRFASIGKNLMGNTARDNFKIILFSHFVIIHR